MVTAFAIYLSIIFFSLTIIYSCILRWYWRLILSAFIVILLSRDALTQKVVEAQLITIETIENMNKKTECVSRTGLFASFSSIEPISFKVLVQTDLILSIAEELFSSERVLVSNAVIFVEEADEAAIYESFYVE